MNDVKNQIIETAAFIFNSYKSNVRIDVISESPNNPPEYQMKLCALDSQPVKFAYQYGEGLINIEKTNTKKTSNILSEFIKINPTSISDYGIFFQKYGFLFPVSADRFTAIKYYQFNKIAERLRCLVDLINELNNYDDTNFRRIMELSLFLFFDIGWSISIGETNITSKKYELAELINLNAFNRIKENLDKQQEINDGFFKLKDTLYGTFELNSQEYHDIVNGYSSNKSYNDFRFRTITYLYVNHQNTTLKDREIIDLLFHYFYNIGVPLSIDSDKIEYYTRFNSSKLNNFFYDDICNFAKYIIKNEIDENIRNTHPVYNEEKMRPDWDVDSLLAAMYFSLFYLDSKKEMLRRCEYCGCYYIVNRSSSTRKFCSSFCRNNSNQARYRLKNKEKNKKVVS